MNLLRLLEEEGIPLKRQGEHHHARHNWVQIDCPMCGPDSKRFHLGLNLYGQYFNCYRCGKLDRVEVISELLHVSPKEAWSRMAQTRDGRELSQPMPEERGHLKLPSLLGPLLPQHRAYLEGRGFDPEAIEGVWKIKAIGVHPKLAWRIVIPIFDKRGTQVSWTARSISPTADLRYVTAKASEEAVNHKHLLYGEHLIPGYGTICVVEGPISAWAIGAGCVATCGLGYTRQQKLRLMRYAVRFVCFDNEPEAQRRARALCDDLSVTGPTYNVVLSAKDPAELLKTKEGRDELRDLRGRLMF